MSQNTTKLLAVRANRLVAGNHYTTNLWSKAAEAQKVELVGWFNEGKPVAAPAVIKAAPQTIELHVRDVATGEVIAATKDPDGYGAMFVGKTRITFGETEEQATKMKQAKTAADESAKAERAAKRAADKAAREAAKAAEPKAEPKKRGRPAKVKTEEHAEVVETTEESVEG